MTEQKAKKMPQKVKIILAKDHIHARQPYKAGSTLEIPETLLGWFRERGLVKEAE